MSSKELKQIQLIKIAGYGFNESVTIVEAKETEKSFMVDGVRFTKYPPNNSGSVAEKRGSDAWNSGAVLYPIDNEYALKELDNKRHSYLQHDIQRRLQKGISKEQAKQIAEILGL